MVEPLGHSVRALRPQQRRKGLAPMTSRRSHVRPHRIFLARSLGWLATAAGFLFRVVLIGWATLAIYYSNLPLGGLRLALAGAFAAFAVWACWISTRRGMPAVFLAVFLGVVVWWILIPPSHDRPWRPEV